MKLYAYYFPNWHVDPKNEKWHGKGWTEWRVTQYATPRFEGHKQPRVPLWGYEDEADPKVMEKKIQTAHNYGIDGFIFDWYWHTDGPYRKRCLEEGFLGAKNNELLDFAVMWCNHTASSLHPSFRYPIASPHAYSTASKEFFREITQYCIDNYFGKPNYITVDGKPYFSLYSMNKFVEDMGEEDAIEAITDFKKRTVEAGFSGLHFNISCANSFKKSTEEMNEYLKKFGIDSVSTYSWDFPETTDLYYDYSIALDLSKKTYDRVGQIDALAIPTVENGWDDSPRTCQSDIYEVIGYPFMPISVNQSPELLERSLYEFYELAKKHGSDIMTITSWNEWTECNYLEPDEEFGYGMLEAVKRFVDSINNQKRKYSNV